MATNKLIDLSRLSRFWDKVKNYISNEISSKQDDMSGGSTTSGVDLNTLADTKTYWVNQGAVNAPTNTYGYLEVFSQSSGTKLQRFTEYNSYDVYERYYVNSQWYSWKKIGFVPATVATSGSYNDLSNKPTSMTPSSHTHGNIQNGGTLQPYDVAIANGDKLVVTDSSDSSKIARTSVTFNGSTANKCLTQKGTWESFTNNAGTVTQVKVGSAGYNPTNGVVSLPATLTGDERIQRFSLTQNSVGLVRLYNDYGSCILLGFVQGIGGVAILVIVANNSISVLKDLSTGNSFNNSYLKITLGTGSGYRDIRVQPTGLGTSTFTAMKSNG